MTPMLYLLLLSIFSRFTKKNDESDEALMLRFQKGDAQAFETLMKRFESPLSAFIYQKLRNPNMTTDLLQETFLRVVKYAQNYDSSAKVKTWIYTIAQNLCIDEMRKKKKVHVSIDAPMHDDSDLKLGDTLKSNEQSALDYLEENENQKAIHLALEGLNVDQKEVFLMREERGLKFHEIAQILNISENTVKSRMRYALEYLREQLGDLYQDRLAQKEDV
jgi:RNA polymerase sigma-70 factor (ECF subfamily)